MGVFKNGVGRPSNETIKKRNIFKGICILLILVIIGLVGYILNDKGIISVNIKTKDASKTKVTKKTIEKVEIDKIKIVNDDDGYFKELMYKDETVDLGIKLPSIDDAMNYVEIKDIKQFKDNAVFNLFMNDIVLVYVMNNKGKITNIFAGSYINQDLFNTKFEILSGEANGAYYSIDSGESKYYEINDNKLVVYSNNLGQEICTLCNTKDDDGVIFSDTYKYENDSIKKVETKVLKTAKKFKKENTITIEDCNNSCKN